MDVDGEDDDGIEEGEEGREEYGNEDMKEE